MLYRGSPSIHWNQEYLQELEQRFVERVKEEPCHVRLLCLAQESTRGPMSPALHQRIRARRTSGAVSAYGIRAEFKQFEDEGHLSVLPVLISRGLRFALFLKMKEGITLEITGISGK